MKRSGKKSLICGILALSLVLAATGYAYWTDTLNVTTKATTGDFGVKFVDLGLYAQYGNELVQGGWSIVDGIPNDGFVDDEYFARGTSNYNIIAKPGTIDEYYKKAAGYHNVKFDAKLDEAASIPKTVGPYTTANTNGSDKISISIQKMYPGYAQAFRSDIINIGEIAAKLSNLKFKVGGLDNMNIGNAKDMIGIALLINREQYHPTVTPDNEVAFKLANLINDDAKIFRVGGVDFVRLSALENSDLLQVLQNNTILCAPSSDQRMDLFLGVAMDPDAAGAYTTGTSADMKNNDDEDSQNKGLEVSIDLLWDQFNVNANTNNPNILLHQNK